LNEEVKEKLLKKAGEKRITCADAREIAEDLGVPYKEVGEAADELGVKIKDCELGCF
jgi:LAO/AO transport system kinase